MKDLKDMTDEEFEDYLDNSVQFHVITVDDEDIMEEIVQIVGDAGEHEEVGGGFDVCPDAVELIFDCENKEAYKKAADRIRRAKHPFVFHFGVSVEDVSTDDLEKLEKRWEKFVEKHSDFFQQYDGI